MRSVFAILTVILAGCATYGDQIDPVESRLTALESENQQLRETVADQKRRMDGMSAVGLDNSVASLQEQYRALRGQLEQVAYQQSENAERQQALYVDLDRRLQALEKQGSGGDAAAAAPNNVDQKAYLAAFQLLKGGQYPAAITAFERFLQEHPQSPYAANSQYWVGEAHYVQRSFDAAWTAFAQVLSQYPDSAKAADALLKQGLVRVEQGKPGEARKLFEQVGTRYPNSTAARLAKERLGEVSPG